MANVTVAYLNEREEEGDQLTVEATHELLTSRLVGAQETQQGLTFGQGDETVHDQCLVETTYLVTPRAIRLTDWSLDAHAPTGDDTGRHGQYTTC